MRGCDDVRLDEIPPHRYRSHHFLPVTQGDDTIRVFDPVLFLVGTLFSELHPRVRVSEAFSGRRLENEKV